MAVDDTQVAKAVNFIARNLCKPITVDEVVAVSGASRRHLYGKFAAHVGHSIHEEIIRQRLELVKLRLRENTGKLQIISEESGFDGAENLSKAFKSYLGISVTEFRRQHRLSDIPRN
jgi:LacI family transcriptional regulator